MKDYDLDQSGPDRPAIQHLMAQEMALYEELLQCLQQEQQALLNLQVDDLFQKVMAKENILTQLLAARDSRQNGLVRLGAADSGETAVLTWLTSLIARHQSQLASLNARVSTINLQNRTLIKDGLEIINEFMGIVSGARDCPPTYQRQGLLTTEKLKNRFNYQV